MGRPTITRITPAIGPTGGLTLVEIEGTGLRSPPLQPAIGPTSPSRPAVEVFVGGHLRPTSVRAAPTSLAFSRQFTTRARPTSSCATSMTTAPTDIQALAQARRGTILPVRLEPRGELSEHGLRRLPGLALVGRVHLSSHVRATLVRHMLTHISSLVGFMESSP